MAKEASKETTDGSDEPICGIIMPISAIPPKYDSNHWSDVRRVLDAAISDAGMEPQIVSDSFESDVIQSRIIHNLYSNEIVVCDVSGLNPNVMFELGMRLTFNKPVIIVTDDFSSIPFDTKVIEHLGYPPDLHIHKTVDFQKKLTAKILQIRKQVSDGNYASPLAAFGSFQVFQPTTEAVSGEKYVAERMDDLFAIVSRLERRANFPNYASVGRSTQNALASFGPKTKLVIMSDKKLPEKSIDKLLFMDDVASVDTSKSGGRFKTEVTFEPGMHVSSLTMHSIAQTVGPDSEIERLVIP